MKINKVHFALAMAGVISFTLAGCGSDDDTPTTIPDQNPPVTTPPVMNPDSLAAKPDNPGWDSVGNHYFDMDGLSESTGNVTVSLGRRANIVQQWMWACAVDATGYPVKRTDDKVTQLYTRDIDGSFDARVAAQLGIDEEDLTETDRNKFFGTDCVSGLTEEKDVGGTLTTVPLDGVTIDGTTYPKLLRLRVNNDSSKLKDSDFADFTNDNVIINIDAEKNGIVTHEPVLGGRNANSETMFDVDLADMSAWLENVGDDLGKGTSRPDLYQPNHYSTFDLFRYIDFIRPDLEITITKVPFFGAENGYPSLKTDAYELSEINTYEFTVNWDVNGDGIFDEADNQFVTAAIDADTPLLEKKYDREYPAYFESNRWHFKFNNDRGYGKGDRGTLNVQNYMQMDRFALRPNQQIRFFPEFPGFTERREWLMEQDVARHIGWGGKINVPNEDSYPIDEANGKPYTYMELLYFLDGDVYGDVSGIKPVPYAMHMKVHPFDMRSDMYKPGVITMMDIFLAANEHNRNDDPSWVAPEDPVTPEFEFNFWAVLSSKAIVNQFGLDKAPLFGQSAGGLPGGGIIMSFSSKYSKNEFGASVQDCSKFNIDGVQLDGTFDVDTQATQDTELCFLNFKNNANGGYFVPEMLSSYMMPYGMDSYQIMPYPVGRDPDVKDYLYHLSENYEYDFNRYEGRIANNQPSEAGSVSPDVATVRRLDIATAGNAVGNAPVLNENHFGWNIADCNLCHNDEKDPKGHAGASWPVNSAEGYDNTQPHFCATCHGNNGAPNAHGTDATCWWCHSPGAKGVVGEGLENHGAASTKRFFEKKDWIANITEGGTRNPNEWGNFSEYEPGYTSTNDYYDLDKTWPDPWSCGTCHREDTPAQ